MDYKTQKEIQAEQTAKHHAAMTQICTGASAFFLAIAKAGVFTPGVGGFLALGSAVTAGFAYMHKLEAEKRQDKKPQSEKPARDKIEMAPGFVTIEARRSAAYAFLDSVGQRPKEAAQRPAPSQPSRKPSLREQMDRLISNTSSIEIKDDANDPTVLLVSPVDLDGNVKKFKMRVDKLDEFQKRLDNAGVPVTRIKVHDEGSTIERSLGGLPHGEKVENGVRTLIPSKEEFMGVFRTVKEFAVNGIKALPAIHEDTTADRDYSAMPSAPSRANGVEAPTNSPAGATLSFDPELLRGADRIIFNKITSEGPEFCEISVRAPDGTETFLATRDIDTYRADLKAMAATSLPVERRLDDASQTLTIGGRSVTPEQQAEFDQSPRLG